MTLSKIGKSKLTDAIKYAMTYELEQGSNWVLEDVDLGEAEELHITVVHNATVTFKNKSTSSVGVTVDDFAEIANHMARFQVVDETIEPYAPEVEGYTWLIGDGDDALAVTLKSLKDNVVTFSVWVRTFGDEA